jgi:hypothetical protein
MRGAPPNAVQELAEHATLAVTMQYVHLAPVTLRSAIAVLEVGTRGQRPQGSISKLLELFRNGAERATGRTGSGQLAAHRQAFRVRAIMRRIALRAQSENVTLTP